MLQDNPNSRPTAADCLKHPWMNEASNCSLALKRARLPGPSSPKSYPEAEEPLPKVIETLLKILRVQSRALLS